MLGIIDYGAGNIQSITNALDYVDIKWGIIKTSDDFSLYTHILLPGVGAFNYGMEKLNERGFVKPILEHVNSNKPFLGICLGMQLLFEEGEEHGVHKGLGIIKGQVKPFNNFVKKVRIPHVGWNDCKPSKESKFDIDKAFYFTHSCFCICDDEKDSLTMTEHEINFTSAVQKGNVVGFQFHPEKSHTSGINLLKSFMELSC